MDSDKLAALNMYLQQKNETAENSLAAYAEQLYTKVVPQNVRDFIEMTSQNSAEVKQKKISRSTGKQTETP